MCVHICVARVVFLDGACLTLLAFATRLFAHNFLDRLFRSILPRQRAYHPLREALVNTTVEAALGNTTVVAARDSPVDALHQLETLRLAEVRPSREKSLPSSRQLP